MSDTSIEKNNVKDIEIIQGSKELYEELKKVMDVEGVENDDDDYETYGEEDEEMKD